MPTNITETMLTKAIKARCKDCQPDGIDKNFCKGCQLTKTTNLKSSILRYCKDCRCGNGFDSCNSEDCPFFKYMPTLIKEVADKLKK